MKLKNKLTNFYKSVLFNMDNAAAYLLSSQWFDDQINWLYNLVKVQIRKYQKKLILIHLSETEK